MSVMSAVAGFAVVAGLVTIIPGLDTALVLRSAVTHGRAHAAATAVGVNTGALVWGAGAAVGVSALLTASTLAYTCLRVAGAAYMVWLGLRLRRGAARRPVGDDATPASSSPSSLWHGWRTGFLTDLLNPKVGAFYVAVLPQFIPTGTSPLAMGLLLALVHGTLATFWFTALIVAAGGMRRLLRSRAGRRVVDGVTGSVLVGFGVRLGLSSR